MAAIGLPPTRQNLRLHDILRPRGGGMAGDGGQQRRCGKSEETERAEHHGRTVGGMLQELKSHSGDDRPLSPMWRNLRLCRGSDAPSYAHEQQNHAYI